jgi:hypothetical protein
MGDVFRSLIQPLEARFKFDKDEEAAAKEDMMEDFKNFSDEILAAAAKKIRSTRTYKTMPTVGEIATVLAALSYSDKPQAAFVNLRKSDWEEFWSKGAICKANKLIQSELGRRAAKEGWITGLHDYCRNKGELPSVKYSGFALESIIREMKAAAKCVDQTAAGVGFKPINPNFDKRQKLAIVAIQGDLRKFGDAFLVKREKLAKIALGETGLDEEGNPTGPVPKVTGPDPYLVALEADAPEVIGEPQPNFDGYGYENEPPPWQPEEGRA